ncbi:Uncharacterized protein FWK35_00030344 [Aphis craccivora]|uniref:Uncharacterized protein n=1 Tax=Aphis craccivora TaxID=307492 RepID=A0A6G0VJ90_APHCR|nr:Uncharacterized protein FWK35_00030344 [Aphis craccivora]
MRVNWWKLNDLKTVRERLFYVSEMLISKLTQSSQLSTIMYEQLLTKEVQDMSFKTTNVLACKSSNFNSLLKKMKISWSLKSIDCIQLRINKVNPLKGGNTYFDLPIINVKNNDNESFKYSILSKYDNRLNKSRFNKKYFDMFIRSQRTKNCSKLIIYKRCFTSFGNKPCKSKLWGESGLIRHKQMYIKNKLGMPIMFEEGDDDFIYLKL